MADALFFPKAKNFKRAAIVVNVLAIVGFLVFIGFSVGRGIVARDEPPTTLKVAKESPFTMPNFLVCGMSHEGHFAWEPRPAAFANEEDEDEFEDACSWAKNKKSDAVACGLNNFTLIEIPGADEGDLNRDPNSDEFDGAKIPCIHIAASDAKLTDALAQVAVIMSFEPQLEDGKFPKGGVEYAVTATDATFAQVSSSTTGLNFIQDYVMGVTGQNAVVSVTKSRHETLSGSKTTYFTLSSSAGGRDDAPNSTAIQLTFKPSTFIVQTIKETDPIGATEILGIVGGAWAYVGLIVAVFFAKDKEGSYSWRWADAKDAGGKVGALKKFGKESIGLKPAGEEEPTEA